MPTYQDVGARTQERKGSASGRMVSNKHLIWRQLWLKDIRKKIYVTDPLLLSKYDLYLQSEPTEDWETAATFSEFGSGSITLMSNFALHSTRGKRTGDSLLRRNLPKAFESLLFKIDNLNLYWDNQFYCSQEEGFYKWHMETHWNFLWKTTLKRGVGSRKTKYSFHTLWNGYYFRQLLSGAFLLLPNIVSPSHCREYQKCSHTFITQQPPRLPNIYLNECNATKPTC